MDYVKTLKDDGTSDPDRVVREDGLQIRRAPTPHWAEYERFLAAGGVPLDKLPRDKWARLNAAARSRLHHAREDYGPAKPAGSEPPLPVLPPDPLPASAPADPRRASKFQP